jgi:hypothetical protein
VLAAASLAIPAAASGSIPSGYATPASTGWDQATTDSTTTLVLHRDGSKAVPFIADVSTPTVAAAPGDGFDWGDAGIGAGAVLGIVALGGAGLLTLRRHREVGTALSGS